MAIAPNKAGFSVLEGVVCLFVNVLCQPSCRLWVGLKFGSNRILMCHLDYTLLYNTELALGFHPPTIERYGQVGA